MKRICNYSENPKVFFVGAGISVNPPTCFPIAGEIISKVLEAIAPDEESLNNLILLADSERPDKRNPGDYIRFELLLDIIQQIADPELSILKMADIFDEPNPLHTVLARRALMGDIVITTNFDGLIEESILQIGGKPHTICKLSEFPEWKQVLLAGRTPVFKLHGSYMQYIDQTCNIAIDTVQATIGAVTTGATDLILPESKRNFLIEITHGREVIIAGYSGSDDLDIMPTFNSINPSLLKWIDHDDLSQVQRDETEKIRFFLKTKPTESLSSKEHFFKNLMKKGKTSVKLIKTNTLRYMINISNATSFEENDFYNQCRNVKKIDNFFKNWEQCHLEDTYKKYMIIGSILLNLGRFVEAYQHFLKAHATIKSPIPQKDFVNITFFISRAAIEINMYDIALEWIEKAMESLNDEIPYKTVALCLHQYGYVQDRGGKSDEALMCYNRCEKYCKQHEVYQILSYAIHDKAIIFQERSEYKRAIALYEKSIKLSSDVGDIKHVAFSLHQIGILNYDLGNFDIAKEYYSQASRISSTIGFNALLSSLNHELGLVEFLSGNVLNSISFFRKSLSINKLTGHNKFTPMHYQHIAIGFMELGKYNFAYNYYIKARDGYETVQDEITLSELYSYIALYYLEIREVESALESSLNSARLSKSSGIPDFQIRAEFMVGLAKHNSGKKGEGSDIIFRAILQSKKSNLMALVLDLIYYCARFQVIPSTSSKFLEIAEDVLRAYLKLGNSKRYIETKKFLTLLNSQSLLPVAKTS